MKKLLLIFLGCLFFQYTFSAKWKYLPDESISSVIIGGVNITDPDLVALRNKLAEQGLLKLLTIVSSPDMSLSSSDIGKLSSSDPSIPEVMKDFVSMLENPSGIPLASNSTDDKNTDPQIVASSKAFEALVDYLKTEFEKSLYASLFTTEDVGGIDVRIMDINGLFIKISNFASGIDALLSNNDFKNKDFSDPALVSYDPSLGSFVLNNKVKVLSTNGSIDIDLLKKLPSLQDNKDITKSVLSKSQEPSILKYLTFKKIDPNALDKVFDIKDATSSYFLLKGLSNFFKVYKKNMIPTIMLPGIMGQDLNYHLFRLREDPSVLLRGSTDFAERKYSFADLAKGAGTYLLDEKSADSFTDSSSPTSDLSFIEENLLGKTQFLLFVQYMKNKAFYVFACLDNLSTILGDATFPSIAGSNYVFQNGIFSSGVNKLDLKSFIGLLKNPQTIEAEEARIRFLQLYKDAAQTYRVRLMQKTINPGKFDKASRFDLLLKQATSYLVSLQNLSPDDLLVIMQDKQKVVELQNFAYFLLAFCNYDQEQNDFSGVNDNDSFKKLILTPGADGKFLWEKASAQANAQGIPIEFRELWKNYYLLLFDVGLKRIINKALSLNSILPANVFFSFINNIFFASENERTTLRTLDGNKTSILKVFVDSLLSNISEDIFFLTTWLDSATGKSFKLANPVINRWKFLSAKANNNFNVILGGKDLFLEDKLLSVDRLQSMLARDKYFYALKLQVTKDTINPPAIGNIDEKELARIKDLSQSNFNVILNRLQQDYESFLNTSSGFSVEKKRSRFAKLYDILEKMQVVSKLDFSKISLDKIVLRGAIEASNPEYIDVIEYVSALPAMPSGDINVAGATKILSDYDSDLNSFLDTIPSWLTAQISLISNSDDSLDLIKSSISQMFWLVSRIKIKDLFVFWQSLGLNKADRNAKWQLNQLKALNENFSGLIQAK